MCTWHIFASINSQNHERVSQEKVCNTSLPGLGKNYKMFGSKKAHTMETVWLSCGSDRVWRFLPLFPISIPNSSHPFGWIYPWKNTNVGNVWYFSNIIFGSFNWIGSTRIWPRKGWGWCEKHSVSDLLIIWGFRVCFAKAHKFIFYPSTCQKWKSLGMDSVLMRSKRSSCLECVSTMFARKSNAVQMVCLKIKTMKQCFKMTFKIDFRCYPNGSPQCAAL